MIEVGRWYAPDVAAVPERSEEQRARDERSLARLREKGITDFDPWEVRRQALAAAALFEAVLAQFGPLVEVEVRVVYENADDVRGRLERVTEYEGVLTAVFGGPFAPDFENSVNCEDVTAIRVCAAVAPQ